MENEENEGKNGDRMHTPGEALLFRFRESLSVLGRSSATVTTYTEHVRHFLMWVNGRDIRQITRKDIEGYIVSLTRYRTKEGRPYGMNTVILKVRSIKRFFEFLEGSNLVFIDPASLIREPRKQRTLPKGILAPGEVSSILEQPNLGTLTGIRDRTILEVFYSTGIRLKELCSLTIYDADLQGGMLKVNRGKGGKDRIVPLGRHAIRFLKEYITKVRPLLTKKNRIERRLFVDIHGHPISTQVVSIMVKKCSRAAGIKKQVTPHTLRHTFASELISNGADITAVQRMLGHVDIRTTQVYIRSLGLDLKKAHVRTHPREKDKALREELKPAIERIRPRYEQGSAVPV